MIIWTPSKHIWKARVWWRGIEAPPLIAHGPLLLDGKRPVFCIESFHVLPSCRAKASIGQTAGPLAAPQSGIPALSPYKNGEAFSFSVHIPAHHPGRWRRGQRSSACIRIRQAASPREKSWQFCNLVRACFLTRPRGRANGSAVQPGRSCKTPPSGVSHLGEERSPYSWGPAATRALPASLPVYLSKFFTKREARSLALVSHSVGSA